MAKLTAASRKKIKGSSFALPGRRYPIEDASHARNALSRVSQNGSSSEKATVRAAVARKYPGIGKKSPRTTATRKNPGHYRHRSQTQARRRG